MEGITYLPCLAMLGDSPGLQIYMGVGLKGKDLLLEMRTHSGLT